MWQVDKVIDVATENDVEGIFCIDLSDCMFVFDTLFIFCQDWVVQFVLSKDW